MTADRHRVDWAHFDVTFAGPTEDRDPSELLVEALRSRALPAMERALDRIGEPDVVTVVEELEFDLGTLDARGWEDRLADALEAALTRALRSRTEGAGRGARAAAGAAEVAPGKAERAARAAAPDHAARGLRHLTRREADLEIVRDFLASGRLPWRGASLGSVDFDALLLRLIREDPVSFVDAVRRWVREGRVGVVPRLVRQLPGAALAPLLRALSVPDASRVRSVVRALPGVAGIAATGTEPAADAASRVRLEHEVLEEIVSRALSGTVAVGIDELVGRAHRSVSARPRSTASARARHADVARAHDPVASDRRAGSDTDPAPDSPEAKGLPAAPADSAPPEAAPDDSDAGRLREALLRNDPLGLLALLGRLADEAGFAAHRLLIEARREPAAWQRIVERLGPAERSALLWSALGAVAPEVSHRVARSRTDWWSEAGSEEEARVAWAAVELEALARLADASGALFPQLRYRWVREVGGSPESRGSARRGARPGSRSGELPASHPGSHPRSHPGGRTDVVGMYARVDRVRRAVFGSALPPASADVRGSPDLADVVERLAPAHIRGIVRDLRTSGVQTDELATRVPADALEALVAGWLEAAVPDAPELRAGLPRAAARASDPGRFMARVLLALAREERLDLEAWSRAEELAPHPTVAEGVTAAEEPGEETAGAARVLGRALSRLEAALSEAAPASPVRVGAAGEEESDVDAPLRRPDPVRAFEAHLRSIGLEAPGAPGVPRAPVGLDIHRLAALDRLLAYASVRRAAVELLPEHLLARLVLLLRPLSYAAIREAGDLLLGAALTDAPASAHAELSRARWRAALDLLADGELASPGVEALIDPLLVGFGEHSGLPVEKLGTRFQRPQDAGGALPRTPPVPPTPGTTPAPPAPGRPEGREPEERRVENAGLVLVAPFLPRLFDVLGLLDDRAFRDEAAAVRGVQLLQHLATGDGDTPEFLLPLNKLLCGVPYEVPIPRRFEPTDAEAKEVDGLLHAVIGHWSALGNTSVEGLRGSFLCRPGTLRTRDEHVDLEVEPRAFDMLLDRIPWGFGTIRLSWMSLPLHVEWR